MKVVYCALLKSEDDSFVFELFNFDEYYSLDFN